MKKRIITLVLSVCLLLALAPVNLTQRVYADQVTPGDDLFTVDKVGKPVEGTTDEYEIELTVTARDDDSGEDVYTDVVVLMDATNSVTSSGWKYVQQDVSDLLDTLLSEERTKARVALVRFTDMQGRKNNAQETTFVTSGLDGTHFYTYDTLETAKSAVESLVGGNGMNGWTNIQLPMIMAQKLFEQESSENNKKIVVLVTDGAPNAAIYLDRGTTSTVQYQVPTHTAGNHNTDRANYNFTLASGTDMKFVDPISDSLTVKSSSSNYERGGENSDSLTRSQFWDFLFGSDTYVKWDCVDCNTGDVAASSNSSAMTIGQSTYIQSQMLQNVAEVYTVAVNVDDTDAQRLIKNMATDDDHAFDVDNFADLSKTLTKISSEIKIAADNIQVADAMSEYVDLKYDRVSAELPSFTTKEEEYLNGSADVYISQGELTYSTPVGGEPTITWQIGRLSYGQTATMRYHVKLHPGLSGDNIPLNDPTKLNYDLGGEPQEPIEFPVPEAKKVTYTVKHYKQKDIGSSVYEEVTGDAEELTGFVGAKTVAEAKTYAGYEAQEFSQVEITEDPKALVEIYYDLQTATYTVHHWKQKAVGSLDYEEVTDDADELVGIVGADTEAVAKTYEGFAAPDSVTQETVKADNSTVVNIYYDIQTATYTVRHWKQKTAGVADYEEVTEDAENLTGVVGADTAAEAKEYVGYTAESVMQLPVKADNTTVVNIYYSLQTTTYTVRHWKQKEYGKTNHATDYEEVTADEQELTGSVGGTTAAAAKTTYTGYTAESFEQQTIEAGGTTVVDIYYNIQTANYTVHHWKQKESGKTDYPSDYEEVETDEQILTGIIGEDTAAVAKSYAGYTAGTVTQKTIAADGSTRVDILYTIQTAEYTVRHWKQKESGKTVHATDYEQVTSDEQILTGAVGTTTAAESKTYAGYTAEAITQETIKQDGTTVVNVYYNFSTAGYTVKHYLQNLENNDYTEATGTTAMPNPESKTGMAGEDTEAEARNYTGFTAPGSIAQKIIAPDSSTVVEIRYTRNSYDYTVRYVVMDGGTPTDIAEDTLGATSKYGSTVSVEVTDAKEIPGYTLKTNTKQDLTIDADVDKNVIFFEYEENTVTISYSAGTGGSVSSTSENVKAVTGTPSGTTPIPAPGYAFDGWYTDPGCTVAVTTDDGTVDESTNALTPAKNSSGIYADKTYYAKFAEKDITIKYVAVTSAGGAVTSASETVKAKTGTVSGSTASPKPGYSFAGWYTDSGCTTPVTSADGTTSEKTFTPAKGTDGVYEEETFYALFTENDVTITYTATTGGSVSGATEVVKASTGTVSGVTAIPSPGYEFDGWYSDSGLTTPVTAADGTVDGAKFTPAKNNDGIYEQKTYYPKFKEILGSLTITKTGCEAVDANQSFIFHITSASLTNTAHEAVSMTVTVKGNASVTIKNLPIGTYTVTEDANWSWRYTPDSASKDGTVTKDGGTVSFANTRAKKNWLTASDVVVNIIKK